MADHPPDCHRGPGPACATRTGTPGEQCGPCEPEVSERKTVNPGDDGPESEDDRNIGIERRIEEGADGGGATGGGGHCQLDDAGTVGTDSDDREQSSEGEGGEAGTDGNE